MKSGGKVYIKKRENERNRKKTIKYYEKPKITKSIPVPIIIWGPFWTFPVISKFPDLTFLHDCTVYTSIFDQSWLPAKLLTGSGLAHSLLLKAVTQETVDSFELYTLQASLITVMNQRTRKADSVMFRLVNRGNKWNDVFPIIHLLLCTAH